MTIDLTQLKKLASGWDGDVYALNSTTILKAYRRTMDLNRLEKLQEFLEQLATITKGFVAPQIISISIESGLLSNQEAMLPGRTIYSHLLDNKEQDVLPKFIDGLTEHLALPAPKFYVGYGSPLQQLFPTWAEFWHDRLENTYYQATKTIGAIYELPSLLELHQEIAKLLPTQPPATVIHGDFNVDNVLWDADSQQLSVLDYGEVLIGDNLYMLAATWMIWQEYVELRYYRNKLWQVIEHHVAGSTTSRQFKLYYLLAAIYYISLDGDLMQPYLSEIFTAYNNL